MSNNLKSIAADLANINVLVNLLAAPVVTEAMIAEAEEFMGPCPEHIREQLLTSNATPTEKVPDLASGLEAVAALTAAMTNGDQITPDMVAAVEEFNGEPAPAEVLEAISQLNLLHAAGFRQDQCNCDSCASERLDTPKRNTSGLLNTNKEDQDRQKDLSVTKVNDILKEFATDPKLDAAYPVVLGCMLISVYTEFADDRKISAAALDCVTHLRDQLLGETGGF